MAVMDSARDGRKPDQERTVGDKVLLEEPNSGPLSLRPPVGRGSPAMSTSLSNVAVDAKRRVDSIMDSVRLLEAEKLSEGGAAALASIIEGGGGLLRLLTDAVELEKLELGRLCLTIGPFSPRELAFDLVGDTKSRARALGLRVITEISEDVPENVLGDGNIVKRVLSELIDNAFAFTQSGSVTLKISRPAVSKADELCYEVRDTGPGIQNSSLALLFEPFYRGPGQGSGGSGLGLSICRDLVNLMGGTINLMTSAGGTSVVVSLIQPSVLDREPSVFDDAPAEGRRSMRSPMVKPKVLLVEDDPDNRRLIARFIESAGYQVDSEADARSALGKLKESEFDILVTDISMPGMDGIELVTTWRREEAMLGRSRMPAVVLTAHATAEYQERCRVAGIDVFLTKPVKKAILRRALAKIGQGVARVLVVDADETSRSQMEAILEGYPLPLRIESVASEREAVSACMREAFSLIFVEVVSHASGAVRAAEIIRGLPGFARAPCVGYIGAPGRSELHAFSEAGLTEVLDGPLDRQQVHRSIQQHLRNASVHVQASTSVKLALPSAPTILDLAIPTEMLRVQLDGESREEVQDFLQGVRSDAAEVQHLLEREQFSIIGAVGTNMRIAGRLHHFEELSAIGARLEQAAARSDSQWITQLCERLQAYLGEVQIEAPTIS